tara:strand:+ start:1172 stop:1759 length:588 start_codon:yes stop_codon:yes gene_type:complete
MWGVARQKKARARVFFLTAFWKEDLWKKKVNPFPTQNKKLSNPISASRDSFCSFATHTFSPMGTIKTPLEQAPPTVPEFHNEQDVLRHYEQLSSDCDAARSKIQELQNQAKEHELVVDAIKDLDPERKCFRQVGGVLVERKVKEVLPAVRGNKEQLDGVVGKIEEQLNVKEMELAELKRKYQIRERGEQAPGDEE